MQVCIVEDDVRLAAVLRQALEEDGATTVHLTRGEDAAKYIVAQSFDAVVLDLMLPGISGLDVLEQIRNSNCTIPVLVLSARDTVPQMVQALDRGADDYLTKPFHLDLFLARVRSVSRRGSVPQAKNLVLGPLTLVPAQRRAFLQGRALDLGRREYMLLETLMRRSGRVVTREQLMEAVWGFDADVSKGNLDYHMHSLRQKLGPGCDGMVRTLRGVGYILQSEASAA